MMVEAAPTRWTQAEDLIDAWIGEDIPTDLRLVSIWIARAERVLRKEFPSLPTRVTSGAEPDLADAIRDVTISMVTRVFRNPSGVRQVQETTGTFTGSTTFAGVAPGQLYLEDSERDLLREPGQAGAGAAYSVSLLAGAQPVHSPFCSLQLGGVRCSCGANIAGRPIYENGE